jgi:hypothetical protein
VNEINAESIEIDLVAIEDTTHFSDNEQVEVEHVNFEFDQRNELHGMYRRITVFNDTHCYMTIQNKHQRKHKYRLDIAYLDLKPYRQRRIAWKWLYACLALLVFDLVLYFGPWGKDSSIAFMGLVVGVTVVAAMTLIGFFYYSTDRVYFRSQHGKVRLLEFLNRNPNNAMFREFLGNFIRQISAAKAAKNQDIKQALARELRELRRLHEEKVVPKPAYERAKQRILKQQGFSG